MLPASFLFYCRISVFIYCRISVFNSFLSFVLYTISVFRKRQKFLKIKLCRKASGDRYLPGARLKYHFFPFLTDFMQMGLQGLFVLCRKICTVLIWSIKAINYHIKTIFGYFRFFYVPFWYSAKKVRYSKIYAKETWYTRIRKRAEKSAAQHRHSLCDFSINFPLLNT